MRIPERRERRERRACPPKLEERRRERRAHTLLVAAFAVFGATAIWATCGGGGGGGTGGMSGGSAANPEVYPVPWKMAQDSPVDPHGLMIYWFPASQNELEKSSLRNSRALSLYASQCVALGVADGKSAFGQRYVADQTLPVAVLTRGDGSVIGKAVHKEDGKLRVDQVEKLLEDEVKQEENGLKETMKAAKALAKADKDGAIAKYKEVAVKKCLFPKQAKDAASELKKLGVTDGGTFFPVPVFEAEKSARIEATMKRGLVLENAAKYPEAGKVYEQARKMDPADPAPLRYLGELYRHHIGDWDRATALFNELLAMPSDPLSRAVALHGLGKITIHNGEFDKGRSLMEQSVKAFPIALAYRNLAVYWNSEGDAKKADAYTKLALDLDPKDPFNLIFAAAFMADTNAEAALKIAKEHESELSASYNLAAVYAQIGQKDKALALLKRHFFEYERYDAVRAKEMMEARVDAVFSDIVHTPEFMELTKGADGKLPMPMKKR
jgi:tetratricopeptide (TPR) repeat protein